MKRFGNITDISDERARAYLRGLLNQETDAVYATLNHLRGATKPVDAEKISRVFFYSPLFSNLKLFDDFPSQPPFPVHGRHLVDQSLHNEIVFQGIRIEKNEVRLQAAIRQLAQLNEAILSDDGPKCVEALKAYISKFGYSLLILSKLAYARDRFEEDGLTQSFLAGELDKYGAQAGNAITLSAMDMMGDSYDFIPLRRNLLEFANSKIAKPITRDIVNWQFRPIRFIQADLASQLQSHGRLSVLDVFVFVCLHRFNVDIFNRLRLNGLVDKFISPALRKEWLKLSESTCPSGRIAFKSEEKEFHDFNFYRRSLAWIEYKTVSLFRNGVDPLYLENTSPNNITNEPAVEFLEKYFRKASRLELIVDPPSELSLSLTRYSNAHAGTFLRTLAFIYLMRKGAKSIEVSSFKLLSLFNWTRDIPYVARATELRDFFSEQQGDALGEYLAAALIADASSLNMDQHRYRRAIQEIVKRDFESDLLKFAEFLFSHSPHVANHLFESCREALLTQLYFLLPTPEAVLETRARLLDWYADAFDEPGARERAKTLRLDQRLRALRGEIDDTRIYVDAIRFGQWTQDRLLDELSIVLQGAPIDDAAIDSFKTFGDFAEKRQPHVRLAMALQLAFEEFCSNKRYGVDSYLGRRIRHGTLKGVMVAQLRAVFQKQKYVAILGHRNARQYLDGWLAHYDEQISYWGQEVFQIYSKQKPKGAIVTDITTSEKIDATRSALKSLRQIFSETKSLHMVNVSIFEWCWILIEKDLRHLRMLIDSARINWGMLSRIELISRCPGELEPLASELCREVNVLTDEKFRLLGRWFVKPTNLAPSTALSLLLDAVLEEVKGQFPDYQPKIARSGLSDIELVGMYYHHVYDFLYVVIYNAAKHGSKRGILGQKITVEEFPGRRRLEIEITSQIAPGNSIQTVRENIDNAMGGSIEDAMVVEGRSGLRKLSQLSTDVPQIEAIFHTYGDDTVRFHCVLNLPPA